MLLTAFLWLAYTPPVSSQSIGSIPPAKPGFAHGTRIYEVYLQHIDAVLIKSEPIRIWNDGSSELSLTAEFTVPGTKVTRPDSIFLGFISRSKRTKYDSPTYLIITADGERISFDTTQRKIFIVKETVLELLFTPIPCDIFLKVASAKSVKVTLGEMNLELQTKHLEVLRDVASRTVPHTPSLN